LIKKIRPDIIHAHYIGHFGILAGLYGGLTGFGPIVLTAWGSDILVEAKGFKKWLIKYALKRADLITCDGENSRDTMVNLGINSQKIQHIYHGVDTQIFNPDQKDRGLVRVLFGREDFPVVISARTLNSRGNVETFIKAIPLILNKIPNAKFIIGGKGPEENYLKKLAKSLDVLDNSSFVGFIPHSDLQKYLASSDVYVSPSLLDAGVAVATLDAMACELAPVVTDVADNSKWIKNGENGFIIPTKKPEALAEKVIYLLENEEIRKRFGRINRRLIKEKQEYAKNMEEMEKLYKKLMEVARL
jgi:glycosyltransferase involved in cell wall biosynthesis